MTETWALAALWIGLALFAAVASIWLRVATALSEIVVGTLAQFVIGGLFGAAVLGADQPWIKFLAGAAAIVLTFLAGAELFVLSVARPPEVGDDVETEAVIENSRHYHRRMLAELKSSVSAKGVKTHFEVAVGHPAEQIIFDADRHGADLIVVGHRGRSKLARFLLGSVSKQVVQYAGHPVLVVR